MNVDAIRKDFPALAQRVHGHELVYLDSAATTLKPQLVIDRIHRHYSLETSNVHRGAHYLGDVATQAFESGRQRVHKFLNTQSSDEVVFVSGTTEGMNFIAQTWGLQNLKKDDEILLSEMEHHGNIVPWQMLAERVGAKVISVNVNDLGELDFIDFQNKLSERTRIVSITACSNVLGTNTDMKRIARMAHSVGAIYVVDGAQVVSQRPVDVQDIDCDFFVFSTHKLFGPYGHGVVYGKRALLEAMPPYRGGGSMIAKVTFEKTTFNDIPYRFEAGTPHVEGAVGLHAAIDYIESLGFDKIYRHEHELLTYARQKISELDFIQMYGGSLDAGPIISFNMKGNHHSDVGQILDREGVAVRAGHHCAQPLMAKLGVAGTVRASFSVYNTKQDVDRLVAALKKAGELLL